MKFGGRGGDHFGVAPHRTSCESTVRCPNRSGSGDVVVYAHTLTNNGNADDSVGGANGALVNNTGSASYGSGRLTLGNDGAIKAEAPDVVGQGTGMQKGPTVLLNYRLRLPEGSGGHVLDVTDWMYLVENGTIMNRSQFRKFGITVAELVATLSEGSVERAAGYLGDELAE